MATSITPSFGLNLLPQRREAEKHQLEKSLSVSTTNLVLWTSSLRSSTHKLLPFKAQDGDGLDTTRQRTDSLFRQWQIKILWAWADLFHCWELMFGYVVVYFYCHLVITPPKGTCVLLAIQECQTRLLEGYLEDCELEERWWKTCQCQVNTSVVVDTHTIQFDLSCDFPFQCHPFECCCRHMTGRVKNAH